MKILDIIAAILLVIGGLNWGIYGIFHFNVVDLIFGGMVIDRIVYILVGAAAVYQIFSIKGIQQRWGSHDQ